MGLDRSARRMNIHVFMGEAALAVPCRLYPDVIVFARRICTSIQQLALLLSLVGGKENAGKKPPFRREVGQQTSRRDQTRLANSGFAPWPKVNTTTKATTTAASVARQGET